MKKYIFLFLLVLPGFILAQKTTLIRGFIKNTKNQPLQGVSVKFNTTGTTSDQRGFYELRIPLNTEIQISFSYVGYETFVKTITAKKRQAIRFSPLLKTKTEQLKTVVIKNNKNKFQGITKLDSKKAKQLPGGNAGVENLLMTLPGVNSNNELSTQYNVRGGNFDENLVYVNGIEVYRPFLVRSGQQEGLSFINPNMVQNIQFSAGGFQAKYGDKLSSVLDITYKKPTKQEFALDGSLLGGSFTYSDVLLNDKFKVLTGIRYRDNSLFVNSRQIDINFRPRFTDFQTYLSYDLNTQWKLNFLGNISLNDYNYQPISRRTRFGTVADPIELIVFYEGQERYQYLTTFGAFSADYELNDEWSFTGTISSFNTQESEYFDVAASYNLGEVDTDAGSDTFGQASFTQGLGSQLNHSRNDLDALIINAQIRGTYKKDGNQFDFGVRYQRENIRDRIREWEIVNSLGFNIPNPDNFSTLINDQPYTPYEGPIIPFQSIRSQNEVDISRFSAFAQYSEKTFLDDHEMWFNFGVRTQFWSVDDNLGNKSSQVIFSPRAQLAIKPDWEKDIVFRISSGVYSQPPFYRELRDFNGQVNTDVKAQLSFHIVAGSDYSFKMWERPFKLTTELYYKSLSNVNTYLVDNVRIRYQANNDAEAYAFGFDARLNGEFIPGSESWVSFGYLKTEENQNDRGYIARPTDQRIKFAILFQDYVPNLPELKAYLNLVYNTGVPGGAPVGSDPYDFQFRLRDYRRADLGIQYVITDSKKRYDKGWLPYVKEFTAGIEIFNIFDVQNAITNTWVRDAFSQRQFGIPNFTTPRVFNLKFSLQF